MALRKIMEQREVDIIRRMKKVLKTTVADIARAADRNKSTIYRVLRRSWRPRQRGRPSARNGLGETPRRRWQIWRRRDRSKRF